MIKKLLFASMLVFTLTSCDTGSGTDVCGSYNGHTLLKGSQGGCYYINNNGNKTYVDRSNCHCD